MKEHYRLLVAKIFIVFCVVVSCTLSYCQAAQWEWVTSTDRVTIEIDTSSVKMVDYLLSGRNLICWYKFTNLDKSYAILHHAFRVKNHNMESAVFETYTYDADGSATDYYGHTEPRDYEFKSVSPDSVGEYLFIKAYTYWKENGGV